MCRYAAVTRAIHFCETSVKCKIEVAVISDVHLGTYGCHAEELNRYLKSIKPRILIINGDFIDIGSSPKIRFPHLHCGLFSELRK